MTKKADYNMDARVAIISPDEEIISEQEKNIAVIREGLLRNPSPNAGAHVLRLNRIHEGYETILHYLPEDDARHVTYNALLESLNIDIKKYEALI